MKNKIISTIKAPKAIGPYSQGVIVNDNLVFISGQLPIVAEQNELISNNIKEQTMQCLKNIEFILNEIGISKHNIFKSTVLLNDINDFKKMNLVYESFFENTKPVRTTFQVAALPKQAKIEIEVIASL